MLPHRASSSAAKRLWPSCPLVHILLWLSLISKCKAQLSYNYYGETCPKLAGIVRTTISANLVRSPTAPAAMLRLFFHDCQVQGCDASILLDTQPGIVSEREAPSNLGIRRLDLIDAIKASVETTCPSTVSCADLVVLAAREAIHLVGGPFIQVPLGRRDSLTASSAIAQAELPPSDTGFDGFLKVFQDKGMTLEESVAILGSHTLGVGHCTSVANRLYPERDPNLGPLFYSLLRLRCPASVTTRADGGPVLPNDLTPVVFDTQYFSRAMAGNGLFRVDADVASNPLTAPIVSLFSGNSRAFYQEFSSAFVKLSLSNVLTGSEGDIRSNCRLLN